MGVRVGLVRLGEGNNQREEGKEGVRSSRTLGENGAQPFSFTAGDPGSLWGGITYKRTKRRDKITGLIGGIYCMSNFWAVTIVTHNVL